MSSDTGGRAHVAGSIADLLDVVGAHNRSPLLVAAPQSGSLLERVVGADGRTFVLKRQSFDRDFLMHVTRDRHCRAVALWETGVLGVLPEGIDHCVIGTAREGDEWALLMRDATDVLLPRLGVISRGRWNRLLEAAAKLHARFLDEPPDAHLCSLADRYRIPSPESLLRVDYPDGMAHRLRSGWDIFSETVPIDVAQPVLDLLEDLSPLTSALGMCRPTLLHGDLDRSNLGIDQTQVVMLDWQLAAAGPPAFDLVWFVAQNADRCVGGRDEIVAAFRELLSAALGPRFDPEEFARQLDLAMLGGLVLTGFAIAHDAANAASEEARERHVDELAWWILRARPGIGRLG
ncbi:MAG: phosphotransferase [Actinomycetota bacterium]